MDLDPNLNAFRADLADTRLKGVIKADKYVESRTGHINSGICQVWKGPNRNEQIVNYFHYGEQVSIFETLNDFSWCQSHKDGYVGYIDSKFLTCESAHKESLYVKNMGTFVYGRPDLRTEAIDFYPRQSKVLLSGKRVETRGTQYVETELGHYIPECCLDIRPPSRPDLLSAAMDYLGVPYLWGGRSFQGIDCAGLVQNAFAEIGVSVLRDTYMQVSSIGEAVSLETFDTLKKNDLIYLPGHVMIYAGEGSVIHANGYAMQVVSQGIHEMIEERSTNIMNMKVRRYLF
jgi:hypothetical protein